jgi:4'-phosphopantetheinyl transferase EntD
MLLDLENSMNDFWAKQHISYTAEILKQSVLRALQSQDFYLAFATCDEKMQTAWPLSLSLPISIMSSCPKRQSQYIAARMALKDALQQAGAGNELERWMLESPPCWPQNLMGSLTHTDTLAAAVVRRASSPQTACGIDLENILPYERAKRIAKRVLTPHERTNFGDSTAIITLIFSIKESCYKATHPLWPVSMGFQDCTVTSMDAHHWKATLHNRHLPWVLNWQGVWAQSATMILTLAQAYKASP